MTETQLDIQKFSGALGATVGGVDLSSALTTETVAEIRQALITHHVLFFRNQNWTPDQQLAFGRQFGHLDTHPFVEGTKTHPEIIDVITEPEDFSNFGGGWHTDVTFLPEPDLGSVLYAVEVPSVGGDTLFSNQQLAYETLSDTMKGLLADLEVVHSAGPQYAEGGLSTYSKSMNTKNASMAVETVVHPLVRTHPESGNKALYVNPAFCTGIVGMTPPESQALLAFLYKHAVREPLTCRFGWEPGSIAMWDNRSVMHFALHDYTGERRHMRRITIKGDKPV